MANRCPDCNKFVSLEAQEPEVSSLEISVTDREKPSFSVVVSAEVRVVRVCTECGTEIRAYDLTIDEDITDKLKDLKLETFHPLATDDNGEPVTDESDNEGAHEDFDIEETGVEATEGGSKRDPTSGFNLSYALNCACGETIYEGELSDSILNSEMEEC